MADKTEITQTETTQTVVSAQAQQTVSYLKAGYPLLVMVTAEESRAELEIKRAARECGRRVAVWSHTDGMTIFSGKDFDKVRKDDNLVDPVKMLTQIRKDNENDVLHVLLDLHAFYKSPKVVRLLRDISRDFKNKGQTAIILTPINELPPELDREAVIIDFDLPNRDHISDIWKLLYSHNRKLLENRTAEMEADWIEDGKISDDEVDRLITAAMGLTSVEAENAFSKAVVETLTLDSGEYSISERVMKEKSNAIKKSGVLEYFEPEEKADDIGGLKMLKKWMGVRSMAFSKKAREFGLPHPKGILLVGLPGCGKSLTAKAAANILNVPFIRFDISRVFGGVVGQSERQMREALQTIERIGQCVVWIDEAEKAFAGVGGGGSHDSGVTKRVFGNFLTWMQEKKEASFVVMTVNNIDAIAQSCPEMLRKGRFDEIFFVGLPSEKEREQIFDIHIRKNGRDPKKFDLKKLAKASDKFSGAEIETSVIEGLYAAFYKDRELKNEDIIASIKSTNPLAKTQSGPLDNMKMWAEANAVNASANGDEKSTDHAGRKLNL